MRQEYSNSVMELMEEIMTSGADEMGSVFAEIMNLAMRIERERFLNAKPYERSAERQGFSNGTKSKKLDTPAGTITLQVPKTREHETPFYPASLERGKRSVRAVMLTVAEMYVKGVSTRDVEDVLGELGIEGLSSTQVSRAAKMLDEKLELWRNRELGVFPYLMLDARYEKVRVDGAVRDVALLSAIGVGRDGARRVLGASVALSEAEVHWRTFLESLVARGLHAVEYIVSDDHSGLGSARRAVLPAATWQRCQFHLAQNAIHHAPNVAIRKRIGAELRELWNASMREHAEEGLRRLAAKYQEKHPKLAAWLEKAVPEGFAVFSLPETHRKKLRTSNGIERSIQQELKRRTRKIRVFPSEESLLRLVSAVLAEIDDNWASLSRPYIKFEDQID